MHMCEPLQHLRHKTSDFSFRKRSFPFFHYMVQIVVLVKSLSKINENIFSNIRVKYPTEEKKPEIAFTMHSKMKNSSLCSLTISFNFMIWGWFSLRRACKRKTTSSSLNTNIETIESKLLSYRTFTSRRFTHSSQ